jgi:hypothetical protein
MSEREYTTEELVAWLKQDAQFSEEHARLKYAVHPSVLGVALSECARTKAAAAEIERLTALLRQAESDTALLNRLNAVFEDNAYIAVDDGEGEVRCSATEYADFDEGAVPLMSGRECLTAVVEQLEHREAEFYRKLRAEAEFGGDG